MTSHSCVIVGNGPSLLDKPNGARIDAFDIIVRFNLYVTKGFESHTGTRTDYWFNVINFADKPRQWRIWQPYRRIYLHSWFWKPEEDKLYRDFSALLPADRLIRTQPGDVREIVEYNQSKGEYRLYSTGAIAIWLLLREHRKVTITGFDWWEPDRPHHYSDTGKRGPNHQPLVEKRLIDRLVREGRVDFL